MKTIEKVRKVINDLGYTNKQIGVRNRPGGYETAIHITIKDLSIDLDQIRDATMHLEKVDYCEASHEILAGGNTFISTQYDWEKKDAAVEALKPLAEKIYKLDGVVYKTPEYYIYFWKENPHMPEFIMEHETGSIFSDDRDCKFQAHNAYHVAGALFHMNIKHPELIPALEELTKETK